MTAQRSSEQGQAAAEPAPQAPPFDPTAYWDRRLGRNFTLRGVGLSSVSTSYNRWIYRVRRIVFRRVVRALDVDLANSRVLDVGTGVGFYIRLWIRAGAGEVTGTDIADSAVRRLRDRFPGVRFEQTDISDDVSGLGGDYDVVSAFDVLYHIVDDARYAAAISNIASLLRPGGWFVVSENFLHGETYRSRNFVSRSLGEIEQVLAAAGFETVTRFPMFVLMNWPIDARSGWRRDLWTKRLGPKIKSERWGNLLGALLFPIELALTRILRESPTTEIMICRKAR